MNNENEIMKEFNETFNDKPEPSVEPYRVTQNQNVVPPQENNNINQNISNNSQSITMPNFVTQNSTINIVPEVNNTVTNVDGVNNFNSMNNVNTINNQTPIQPENNQQLYNTTNYINDRPIEKKPKKATIKINPELKTAIILALILLVAMSFIPAIFDLYDSLKIKIFG